MTDKILTPARAAVHAAPPIGDDAYRLYCGELARRLTESWPTVLAANERDVAAATGRGLPPTVVERLRLTDRHLTQLVELTATVETELAVLTAPDPGIPVGDRAVLRRVPKPLGVLLMIYEARPTVTVEGALLPVVAGNAAILRGGKEIAETNRALHDVVAAALRSAGLPPALVSVVDDPDRSTTRALLARADAIDVLVPRGSPALIDYCRTASAIPVIASGGGVNHLYVHSSADLPLAAAIALDSKLPEPTACNTLELVLVDRPVANELLDRIAATGRDVTVRLDPTLSHDGPLRTEPLREHDLGREFLEPALGVLAVDGLDEAVEHIRLHGSAHTEGVVATDRAVTDRFTRLVDAAAIVVNGSLRLHDGPTLGLGAEVSISTGRLHVRGPVTLRALVTTSLVVDAAGTLRTHSLVPRQGRFSTFLRGPVARWRRWRKGQVQPGTRPLRRLASERLDPRINAPTSLDGAPEQKENHDVHSG